MSKISCNKLSQADARALSRQGAGLGRRFAGYKLIIWVWFFIGLTAIIFVPVRPEGALQYLGDLHYLGIAWNMFKSHSWLVTYSVSDIHKVDLEKTPLLYWLILPVWHLVGVSTASVKLLIFLLGSACLAVSYQLARKIFPENIRIAQLTIVILLGNFLWTRYFSASIRFEGLVTFFGLVFLIWLIKFIQSQAKHGMMLAGFSLGLCVFAKGAVGLVYYLPLAFMMPVIFNQPVNGRWVKDFFIILLLGLIPSVLYLLFVYVALGGADLKYLLFDQVTARVGFQFHIKTLCAFLLCFAPVGLLINLKAPGFNQKMGIILLQIALVLIFFTIFVDVQTKRYFIPCCPLIALVLAGLLAQMNVSALRIKLFVIAFGLFFSISNVVDYFGASAKYYRNLSLLAAEVRSLQMQDQAIAQFTNNIANQNLDYLGRLPKNLAIVIDAQQQSQWLTQNPLGYVIEDCDESVRKSRHCLQIKRQAQIISVWND